MRSVSRPGHRPELGGSDSVEFEQHRVPLDRVAAEVGEVGRDRPVQIGIDPRRIRGTTLSRARFASIDLLAPVFLPCRVALGSR